MAYPAISLATATVGRHRCPQKRLQTARQPPVYTNSSPDHRACNSLTPFRCPHAVHPCPSVDSGLAKGSPNKEIASALSISESTAKTHVANIFQKLDVKDRTQAVTQAVQRGIIRL